MTKFDSNRHHRRSIRLKDRSYQCDGMYYVTICTHQRTCLFGKIIDDEVIFSPFGLLVHQEWERIARQYHNCTVDYFVVMPNHIHGILQIIDNASTQALNAFGRPLSGSLGTVVGSFKSRTAWHINRLRSTRGQAVWQRGYYEHIVRGEKDLQRIREYILYNPLSWNKDDDNPSNWTHQGLL